MTETCRTCVHFHKDKRAEYEKNGHCWRYPPTLVWAQFDVGSGDWNQDRPYVDGDIDYCGEYREDPFAKYIRENEP